MDIQLPGAAAPISGTAPIVIIGPNGVGKTQLGVAITRSNSGERVAALRNVEIPEIPMQRFEQADEQVRSALQDVLGQHWRQSYELQNLMASILAEDRETAVKYKKAHRGDPSKQIDESLLDTRLDKIVRIWNRHFPGRTINIDYQPVVNRVANGKRYEPYPIARMSEGERTALYLAARVVSCKTNVLVVDEPESFFHPLLAKNLWNDLEAETPNIRFVYITHDIPFALSRRNAQFAIARSESAVELLPPTSSIPPDVVAEVLGAASFSISASRLIFCEGKPKSLDQPILSAWHNCDKTAIVPVGSCTAVRECVSVFQSKTVTNGLEAFGYVDRDGWPEAFLNSDANVKAHPISEIEGFFALKPVFKALAKWNKLDDAGAQAAFDAFLKEARGVFKDAMFNKEVLDRAKKRVEFEQKSLLNRIRPNPDLNKVRSDFVAIAPAGGWPTYLTTIFAEEEALLTKSHGGAPEEFVRDFPAKTYLGMVARQLKFVEEKMIETFCDALRLTDEAARKDEKLRDLRDAIIPAIQPYLWARKV